MRLLIVEDEPSISGSITEYLENEQFQCETANTYQSALEKITAHQYACILLDISLPDGSGLDLLKQLQKEDKTDGVLIVSAQNSLDVKVGGLMAGADDYIIKPFHLPELGARVSAIIRRKSFNGRNVVNCENLSIDVQRKTVRVNDFPIDLTKKEYDLLLYFVANRNKVISKDAIAEHLWGDNAALANNYDFIYTHIKNLRRKLVWAGCKDHLRSVYGAGYTFE